jgi:hypothetical protein
MTSDAEQWILNVQHQGKDFMKSPLQLNQCTVISSSFEADIVLRRLRYSDTSIEITWKTPSEGEQDKAKDTPLPHIQITSNTEDLDVDGDTYTKPYSVQNEITIIKIEQLKIIVSTVTAFENYVRQHNSDTPDEILKKGDIKDQISSNDVDPMKTGATDSKQINKTKLRNEKTSSTLSFFTKLTPAIYVAFAFSSLTLISILGYYSHILTVREKHETIQQLKKLKKNELEMLEKIRKKKKTDIENNFNDIMTYYPDLHLTLDYDTETETAVISGFSTNKSQTDGFVRSLRDDLGIEVEFRINSIQNLSQMINDELSQTSAGEVSLVYINEQKLSCITSSYNKDHYAEIEQYIKQIVRKAGYTNDISCTKVLFSKEEISFVSNADYPFVKLKNGSVFFEDSEVSQGVYLTKIENDKLTFQFRKTKFYLTLK